MAKVVLQPASNKASRVNYDKTIRHGIKLSTLTGFLAKEDDEVLRSDINEADGTVCLWGAKPGEDGRNIKRWSLIQPNDYLFFFMGSEIHISVITHKFRNGKLADKLWGRTKTANGNEQTWELMLAVTRPVPASQDLTIKKFNSLVGRKSNANVQEFVVLPEKKSTSLIADQSLVDTPEIQISDKFIPPSENPKSAASIEYLDELESKSTAVRRGEQAALRQYLLPTKTGVCALCERAFPAQFLVAAHIKRRSECTEQEKRDLMNIAMLNCRFGCDELFGRGLISISKDGRIMVSHLAPEFGAVGRYIEDILPSGTLGFYAQRPGSHKYFAFHRSCDFQGSNRGFKSKAHERLVTITEDQLMGLISGYLKNHADDTESWAADFQNAYSFSAEFEINGLDHLKSE